MQIGLLVSADTWQQMVADPWLSQFDWVCLDAAAPFDTGCIDLLVLDLSCLPVWPSLSTLGCPCWCFSAGHGCWDLPPEVDAFASAVDLEVLSARLMAWLWLSDVLTPACFAGLSLALTNGRLSFRTIEPSRYLMQMSVSPTAEVGGDVALYFESGTRILVVLADAIGHGDEAALDAAQFVLSVVRHIVPSTLCHQSLQRLCASMSRQLASGRFVAAAFVEFDRSSGEVRLVNAGMPDILLLQHGQLTQRFFSSQTPLGLADCPGATLTTLPLLSCCQWVMHSDGVDADALQQSLCFAMDQLAAGDSCSVACSTAVASPLLKTRQITDDASQIIVGIPDF